MITFRMECLENITGLGDDKLMFKKGNVYTFVNGVAMKEDGFTTGRYDSFADFLRRNVGFMGKLREVSQRYELKQTEIYETVMIGDIKVTYAPPYTIVSHNGKKGLAEAEEGTPFDKWTGFSVAYNKMREGK